MKIIWTDGYNRDSVADRLIAENLTEQNAKLIEEALQKNVKNDGDWYLAVSDAYKLSRGMEDLV